MRCAWCDNLAINDSIMVGRECWHIICLEEKLREFEKIQERNELLDIESDLRDAEDFG